MKRSEDSRLIKIPDAASALAAAGGASISIAPAGSVQSNQATVYPQRATIIEIPQQPIGGGAGPGGGGTIVQPIPLTAHRGVTVYRGEPPAAHTGVVVTASGQAAVLHAGPQTIVTQSKSVMDSINLPTAPVSLQYTSTFPGGASITATNGPPSTVVKTISAANHSSVQNLVHSLPPQQPQQHGTAATTIHQVVHGKPQIAFTSPGGIRTISAAPAHTIMSQQQQPQSQQTNANVVNAAAAANAANNSANFQRLKVEDALSYLDQVKFKFGNQPQVYNDFLDIMKEFKSQSIDTPGVIARVSSLFRGHPELIVGFNTFLPPGYKIEVHSSDSIAVSMPGTMGTTVQTIVHTPHGIHKMTTSAQDGTQSLTISTGLVQPLQQQQPHQPQAANIIRLPLPNMATPQGVTGTTIGSGLVSKFQPHAANKMKNNSNQGASLQAAGGHFYSSVPMSNDGSPVLRTGPGHSTSATLLTQATSGGAQSADGVTQPVEFNHAINYVNKIKNRFANQPDVYKQFLEILHAYQKEQKAVKEGHRPSGQFLSEGEVYAQVAKLFQNQEDLLAEFGQFLPEATGEGSLMSKGLAADKKALAGVPRYGSGKYSLNVPNISATQGLGSPVSGMKRPPAGLPQPQPKKLKTGALRDVTLAEAGKFGTLNEYAFFDKVCKTLKNPGVYENFLRCLVLFNQEVISRGELLQLTSPLLSRHPELFRWFKDFIGHRDGVSSSSSHAVAERESSFRSSGNFGRGGLDEERGGGSGVRFDSERAIRERSAAESAMDIDYATCKRLGASYCALPKNFVQPNCSGRTPLCWQVLNDTWVSFPSWSEDSQFVTSRKTQFEEAIYRTEDERFEFDMVLETNKDTIKVLECVQKKMSRMPPEEAARYRLDDSLGGTSSTIHQRAIRRIYGDKSTDIIEGLKRNPVVAVPLVLRRLRAKDEEWREVQKNFNKIWKDQNSKYYLKSLDHQGLLFKQSDVRTLRSKSLLNEIETLYDERHEQSEETEVNTSVMPPQEGPHLTLTYPDRTVLDDANNLLIHHVKRQTSIHKDDKRKIKQLLRQFLMDRFKHPRQDMSDDERDLNEADEDEDDEAGGDSESGKRGKKKKDESTDKEDKDSDANGEKKKAEITEADIKVELPKDGRRTPLHVRDMEEDESYTLFMANNNWYLFLRLHQILCDRLSKIFHQANIIASEEAKDRKDKKESTAVALKLKPKNEVEPEDYYPAFLDMVKNLLDGNMDAQTYEDTLREMFGIHAYISFTLDKVVGNAVRQLQHLISDESCVDCYDLFVAESKAGATGGTCNGAVDRLMAELIYQKKAERLLVEENCMKVILYHKKGLLTIELLDTESEGEENRDSDKEEDVAATRKYQQYGNRFAGSGDDISDDCRLHLGIKPIFLPRSVQSYHKRSKGRELSKPALALNPDMPTSGSNSQSRASPNPVIDPRLKKEDVNDDDDDDDTKDDDAPQCQLSLSNIKVLFIINSENCFYRKQALRKAKESHKSVSLRKDNAFSRWHASWVRQNVTETSHQATEQWLMGKNSDMVPNRTIKSVRNFQDKSPYRVYHKYLVQLGGKTNGVA